MSPAADITRLDVFERFSKDAMELATARGGAMRRSSLTAFDFTYSRMAVSAEAPVRVMVHEVIADVKAASGTVLNRDHWISRLERDIKSLGRLIDGAA